MACGRCGRPLCPDCVRHGATGVRCEDCLRLPARARGLATSDQIIRASAAAFAVGAAGGAVLGWLSWVNPVTGLVLGFAVGSAAFFAGGRHRDVAIQGIAGVIALGAFLLAVVLSALGGAHGEVGGAARIVVSIPYASFILPALAAIAGAILRFLI